MPLRMSRPDMGITVITIMLITIMDTVTTIMGTTTMAMRHDAHGHAGRSRHQHDP